MGDIGFIIILLMTLIVVPLLIYFLNSHWAKIDDNEPLDESMYDFDFDNNEIYINIQKFISDKNEEVVSLLGTNYVENINTENGTDKQGFCILTQKAYYFIGPVLQKKKFLYLKKNIQYRIVATDLKAVRIGYIFNTPIIIYDILCAILLFLTTIITLALPDTSYLGFLILLVNPAIMIIICALIYGIGLTFANKRLTLLLQFSSETIGFPISKFFKNEIKTFYKCVSRVQQKPTITEREQETPHVNKDVESSSEKSKTDTLIELSNLYNQGLIQRDEFDKLKQEIINK